MLQTTLRIRLRLKQTLFHRLTKSKLSSDRSGERGYNAVLAGFNWPPYDFVRVFPWRERYVDRLVPIADVDADRVATELSTSNVPAGGPERTT